MFNSTYYQQGSSSNYSKSHTEIHEHRATTDDSLKLLQEMQDKAAQSIIAKMRVESTALSTAWVVRANYYDDTIEFVCRMQFNNSDVKQMTVHIPSRDLKDVEELCKKFRKQLSEFIACEILADYSGELSKEMGKHIRR